MRQYFLSRESALAQNPESIANRAALGLALPGHPYTMAELGYAEGLKKITPDDLAAARQRIFVKSGLQVAIVGDLSAEEAARYLDDLFGALPEGTRPNPDVKSSLADGPKVKVIAADTAQTLLQFGSQGLPESDPDYHAAVIATFMAYSTLNDVLREQRGLTYGVSFDLLNFNKAHLVIGRAKTANASASAALDAIREALGLMHDPGPNLDVLNRSKAYLKGRFALGFDSGADMAGSLLNQKLSGFSSNYISVRNDLIDQVTLEDVKRAIKRIIAPEKLLVVAVGRPEGLE